MRTWILCLDSWCAKIFMRKQDADDAHLFNVIPRREVDQSSKEVLNDGIQFIRYVADEIEVACGSGTDSQLIICAEDEVLSKVMPALSSSVRSSIIGLLARDLCFTSESYVSKCCQNLRTRKNLEYPRTLNSAYQFCQVG